MAKRIRNWHVFQHYRNRNPTWIKLHKALLDDSDYHRLSPLAGKYLPLVWLIGSEKNGELPETGILAFRLRLSEKDTEKILAELAVFIEDCGVASKLLADRYQVATQLSECSSLSVSVSSLKEGSQEGRTGTPPPKTFKQWAKEDLIASIKETNVGILPASEANKFYLYWSEPDATGRMRMCLQKTWETGRRLKTWRARHDERAGFVRPVDQTNGMGRGVES